MAPDLSPAADGLTAAADDDSPRRLGERWQRFAGERPPALDTAQRVDVEVDGAPERRRSLEMQAQLGLMMGGVRV